MYNSSYRLAPHKHDDSIDGDDEGGEPENFSTINLKSIDIAIVIEKLSKEFGPVVFNICTLLQEGVGKAAIAKKLQLNRKHFARIMAKLANSLKEYDSEEVKAGNRRKTAKGKRTHSKR